MKRILIKRIKNLRSEIKPVSNNDEINLLCLRVGAILIVYQKFSIPINEVQIIPKDNSYLINDTVYTEYDWDSIIILFKKIRIAIMDIMATNVYSDEIDTEQIQRSLEDFYRSHKDEVNSRKNLKRLINWQLSEIEPLFKNGQMEILNLACRLKAYDHLKYSDLGEDFTSTEDAALYY